MRTITEFPAATIKNAARLSQELTASGKTPEELPAALGEGLKLEGDRLTQLMGALEVAGTRFDDLKRVLVLALVEGEKAPEGAVQKGENCFVAEYFPPIQKKGAAPHPGKGGGKDRGGKRGDRRGGKGGRGDRDRDRGKGPRGPRPEGPKPTTA